MNFNPFSAREMKRLSLFEWNILWYWDAYVKRISTHQRWKAEMALQKRGTEELLAHSVKVGPGFRWKMLLAKSRLARPIPLENWPTELLILYVTRPLDEALEDLGRLPTSYPACA